MAGCWLSLHKVCNDFYQTACALLRHHRVVALERALWRIVFYHPRQARVVAEACAAARKSAGVETLVGERGEDDLDARGKSVHWVNHAEIAILYCCVHVVEVAHHLVGNADHSITLREQCSKLELVRLVVEDLLLWASQGHGKLSTHNTIANRNGETSCEEFPSPLTHVHANTLHHRVKDLLVARVCDLSAAVYLSVLREHVLSRDTEVCED